MATPTLPQAGPPTHEGGREFRISLLGGFRVGRNGSDIEVPGNAQRILAFLALRAAVPRESVAGCLWPSVDSQRAFGSLRTGLWEIRQRCPGLLGGVGSSIAIGGSARVDVTELRDRARRLTIDSRSFDVPELLDGLPDGELLPGWYDDWLSLEREHVRQLQLHLLEETAEELLRRTLFGAAMNTALSAALMEPLRESVHRLVIRIHLAEGNSVEARAHYARTADLLRTELGVAPSARLRSVMSYDVATVHDIGARAQSS
jgi:DNA-binding SARP family transcriptional activator